MRKWAFASAGVLALAAVIASTQLVGSQPADTVKAAAPAASAAAKSRIVKVVVYPNSALVTREVEVPAGNGITELVVPELPMRTVNSSLLRGRRRHPRADDALPHSARA